VSDTIEARIIRLEKLTTQHEEGLDAIQYQLDFMKCLIRAMDVVLKTRGLDLPEGELFSVANKIMKEISSAH